MNYEQMGQAFDGGKKKKKSREEHKTELQEFYKRYGLEDKVPPHCARLDCTALKRAGGPLCLLSFGRGGRKV